MQTFQRRATAFVLDAAPIRQCDKHRLMCSGKRWLVDIDLEKFFDRVNHDISMSRVARQIRDKRVLLLIRRHYPISCLTIWTKS